MRHRACRMSQHERGRQSKGQALGQSSTKNRLRRVARASQGVESCSRRVDRVSQGAKSHSRRVDRASQDATSRSRKVNRASQSVIGRSRRVDRASKGAKSRSRKVDRASQVDFVDRAMLFEQVDWACQRILSTGLCFSSLPGRFAAQGQAFRLTRLSQLVSW